MHLVDALAGLLGNVGCKLEDDEDVSTWALAASSFIVTLARTCRKKPGRWIVVAELVETTRLFGRGIAAMEPQWLEQVGGHLLKKQLLDPHWEKKAGEVKALERATLYGLGGLQRPPCELQQSRSWWGRVKSSFVKRWSAGELGHQAAVPRRQSQKLIVQGGRAGTQIAPPRCVGGRRS